MHTALRPATKPSQQQTLTDTWDALVISVPMIADQALEIAQSARESASEAAREIANAAVTTMTSPVALGVTGSAVVQTVTHAVVADLAIQSALQSFDNQIGSLTTPEATLCRAEVRRQIHQSAQGVTHEAALELGDIEAGSAKPNFEIDRPNSRNSDTRESKDLLEGLFGPRTKQEKQHEERDRRSVYESLLPRSLGWF